MKRNLLDIKYCLLPFFLLLFSCDNAQFVKLIVKNNSDYNIICSVDGYFSFSTTTNNNERNRLIENYEITPKETKVIYHFGFMGAPMFSASELNYLIYTIKIEDKNGNVVFYQSPINNNGWVINEELRNEFARSVGRYFSVGSSFTLTIDNDLINKIIKSKNNDHDES